MSIVINGSGTVTGLSVGGLPDGTVDSGTLATNSVVTSKIVDGTIANADINDLAASKLTGTVATANIADNAITLAKMASGTDGNIISYDASGNPVAIATGSDGQVLTSTGAGSPPAFEAIPAGGLSSKLISFTRNSASGAGTQAISGVGFQPTAVLFLASIPGAGMASIGFQDSDRTKESLVDRQLMTANDWDSGVYNGDAINMVLASSVNYGGSITAYASDGFTITWVVRGSPSGTIKIRALCFR